MAEELLIGLFVFGMVVAFITVVGHLIWLVLAAIARAVRRPAQLAIGIQLSAMR